ncbi:MAG: hypothetical protein E6Q83_04990 [Thiothrix sp.]|nr:MAG: hypothetical protein E6Q83_04990 [Thiothrix sp.]
MFNLASLLKSSKCYWGLSIISLSGLLSTSVWAHAGHNDLIQLKVKDQQLGVEIGLNAADFMQFDRNQDGKLMRAEFVEQQEAIKQWLQTQIEIKTEQQTLKPSWFDLPLEVSPDDLQELKHIRLIQRYVLPPKVAVKFQSQLPSFQGKGLLFSSDEHFYMTNLSTKAVEILVQAGTSE